MTRLFPASAMYTVPLLSTATAAGSLSPAKGSWLGAGRPFGSSSTWLEVLLAIYTFPAVSTATPPAPSSPPHGNSLGAVVPAGSSSKRSSIWSVT